jgi:hypothetical protein
MVEAKEVGEEVGWWVAANVAGRKRVISETANRHC